MRLICIFLTLFQGLIAQDVFYFSKQPESQKIIAGNPITLECKVSHEDNIIYYWNLNDTRLNNTTRRSQIESNLHITRVDRLHDSGEYSCIAENVTSKYSLTSRIANLEVLWLGNHATVQLHSPASENEIQIGGEIVLRCLVEGNGETKYEWFKNEELLQKSEKLVPRNKKLHVKEVDVDDNGVYRCKAQNEAGVAESKENFVLRAKKNPQQPTLKHISNDAIAKRGDDFRFDCLFQSADDVRWNFGGEPVLESDTRQLYDNGSLLLMDIDDEDEGIYTCKGVRKLEELEEVQEYSTKLTIAYIDDLTSKSFEPTPTSSAVIIAPEKKPLEVTCLPPKAVPAPKVWWQFPSSPQNVTNSGSVRTNGNLLTFESPKSEPDTGNYTCYAENMAGLRKFTLSLIISVLPIAPSETETVKVDEGESVTFPCPYKGTPYPVTTFKWKKGDKYLNHARIRIKPENGSLFIAHAQPSDRGIYVCEITTVGFKPLLSKSYKLNIIEKLRFTPPPVSKRLELGTAAKIPCKAQGSPPPVVRWLKNDALRVIEFPSNVHDVNGTLHFDPVQISHKGKYVCVATSTQGTINVTVDIDVIVSPKFSVKPQNPTEAVEGYPVMLHCVVEGDPRPMIKWDKNGEMNGLDMERFQVLENGSLLVQYVNIADRGKYGCTAGNSGGLKREEALLIVKSSDGFRPNEGIDGEESMMTKTVTITLSAAAAYMVLVVGLMVWCRYRRKKRKEAYLSANPEGILLAKAENGDAVPNGEKPENSDLRNCRENGRKSDGTDTVHSQSSNQSKRSSKSGQSEKLLFPRQNLSDFKLLGHGIFGQVFVARAENIPTPVLVKSLQHTRDEHVLIEFKRESDIFHRLSHDNVTKIIGLCRDGDPNYMVLEYADWGELKNFLQTTKKERSKLSTIQIVEIAKQVSLGMEHLSNARFVHKDLAARNCVISSDLTVKVSLIGLSKDVYSTDYTQFHNQVIPLRWLPYEAVFEDDYSTKSDVYSFAVFCWELFHQGEKPFYNVGDSIVIEKLQRRELVIKPSKSAPAKMAAILANCSASSPKDRPTFSQIAIVLGEVLNDL